MKIGIDGRLWNETGVGRYIQNLVSQLQELDTRNEYTLFVKQGIKDQELGIKNKKWKIVKTDIHWHSLAEQIKFPQLLYQQQLDLIHFPYFSLPVFYNKPFVVTIHDLIINHFPTGKASTLPYPFYLAKRIGYDFVMHHAVKNSRKIIVPLTAVKKDLQQTLHVPGEKIVVTYEGVATDFFAGVRKRAEKFRKKNSQEYFLYVGNAYPHKNLERLIEGFIAFKQQTHAPVQLVLVGKDDYFYHRLHEKIKREKIADVIIKHNVNDEELAFLYANAQLFISASLMEGFGLPPLEALISSCPVLLSDIPSFREVCGDSAFYFDPLSTKALKDQMNFVYNLDHKTKQAYLKKVLTRIEHFSWSKMAKETIAVYESCVSI